MALSKPKDVLLEIIGSYFSILYTSPIKTKAFTSSIIAAVGNIISQKVLEKKHINIDNLLAFALFGALFGGTIPHYFNKNLYRITRHPLAILLIERLIFMPSFQALLLYMLPIFEGKSLKESTEEVKKLFHTVVTTNWKYLTLLQFINIRFFPPMLRMLVSNVIDLAWITYISNQRSKISSKKKQQT